MDGLAGALRIGAYWTVDVGDVRDLRVCDALVPVFERRRQLNRERSPDARWVLRAVGALFGIDPIR